MDSNERWKTIAPASDNHPGQQRTTPDSRKRRQAIAVACIQCRIGKAKCDGARPRCNRCSDSDLPCQYDVAEGVSRAERMKLLKRDGISSRVEELDRVIYALRSGSDFHASTILARLRLGERVEDVAKSLTTSSHLARADPSIVMAQSESTSETEFSSESVTKLNETTEHLSIRPGSSQSSTQYSGHRPSWPSYSPIQSTSPLRRGSESNLGANQDPAFLHILFDRDDCLLVGGDDKDQDIKEGVVVNGKDDNKDAHEIRSGELSTIHEGTRVEANRTLVARPPLENYSRPIHATHGSSRQNIVDAIQIHANLDLGGLFATMPFSSNLQADHYPLRIENLQIKNMRLPTWAMLSINTNPSAGSLKNVFKKILDECARLIQSGIPVEDVIEKHPNIAALVDKDEFSRSGVLSKWAAGMVHSFQLQGSTFTCKASMYLAWYLMRWMVHPSPETYQAMPEWLRPTPNQLFMPHIGIIDFVVWPAFREFAVKIPSMQEGMEWLMDMSNTIQCDWAFTVKEAMLRDDQTGLTDLCPAAKMCIHDLTNWSVGPSFRGYVGYADSYVRIRTEV